MLSWINILAILGTVATFIGLVYTVISAQRADRRKLLTYEVANPLALATVLPDRSEHKLSIVYEREGNPPLNINGAYLRFIQLGNLGKEPIRQSDIAPSDPLRLEVSDTKVLDVAIAGVSREVINFNIGELNDDKKEVTNILLSFDFLDFQDGAVIRLLTDEWHARVRVTGTIIGMPEGVCRKDQFGGTRVLNIVGCGLAILLQLAAIVGALYLFRNVTGGWSLLWIFLLPIGAFLLPALLVSIVATTIWPKGPKWPQSLILPAWFFREYSNSRDIQYLEMEERNLRSKQRRRTSGEGDT
jgi:hypothetical protein